MTSFVAQLPEISAVAVYFTVVIAIIASVFEKGLPFGVTLICGIIMGVISTLYLQVIYKVLNAREVTK